MDMELHQSHSSENKANKKQLDDSQSNKLHENTKTQNGDQEHEDHPLDPDSQDVKQYLSTNNGRYSISEPGNRPAAVSPGRSTMSNVSNEKMRQKAFKAKYSGSQEDFDYETRFVVLNFMGFVPLSSQSTSQRTSSDESGDRRSHVHSQVSVDSSKSGAGKHRKSGESGEWGGLPSLPELSITEKFRDGDGKEIKESDLVVPAGRRMSPGQRKSPRRPLLHEDIPVGGSRGVQWGGGLRRDSTGIEEEEEEEKEGEKNEEDTGGLLDDADLKMVHVEVEEDSASESLPEPTRWLPHSPSDPALVRRMRETSDIAIQDDFDSEASDELDAQPWSESAVKRPTTIDLHKPITPPSFSIDPSFQGGPPQPQPGTPPPKGPPSGSNSQPATPSPPHRMGGGAHGGHVDTMLHEVQMRTSPYRRKAYTMDSQRGLKEAKWGRENLKWQQSTVSQYSDHSSSSEMDSLMHSTRSHSSGRSDVVDVTTMDVSVVTPLVESKALPSMVLDLKAELDEQFQEMETHTQHSARSMSPESQVAAYLSHLGDKVQEEYGGVLERCLGSVMSQPREEVDYDQFSEMAGEVTQGTSGETKVALLLLFGKRVAHNLVSRGDRGIGRVVEYTTRIIEDQAADFIVDSGGWNSIREIDEEENWHPFDVADEGFTPDSLNQDSFERYEETDVVTSLPHPASGSAMTESSAGMTESFHSDTTDVTVIANIKGRDTSVETISSLATGASDDSLNARLSDSPRESPNGGTTPRIRHGSGPRRGSFTIISYPDHKDPLSQSGRSESKLSRESSGENSNNNMNSTLLGGEYNLLDSLSCTTTCMVSGVQESGTDDNDFTCPSTDNHALVEGTMDPEIDPSIVDDVLFMRQISKELAEESERDRERANRGQHLKVIIAIGVVLVAVVYLWRKGRAS